MINPTPKQIKSVLTILEPEQYMRLVRVIMELRTPEQWAKPLSVRDQLKMYIYEWLIHLGFLSDDKIRWLINTIGFSDLSPLVHWLEKSSDITVSPLTPMFVLTIIDRQYVIWPERMCFADLENETFTDKLDKPGCTLISGDFYPIFLEKQKWLKRLQGEQNA